MSATTPASPAESSATPGTSVGLDYDRIDYSALTAPVTRGDVRAFRARIKAEQRADPNVRTGLTTATGVVAIVGLVFFAIVFVFILIAVIGALASGGSANDVIVPLVFVIGFGALAVALIVRHFGSGGSWAKWMRLSRFAAANGLQFRSRSAAPNYSGMIFGIGNSRSAFNHFTSTSGRYFDFGDYQYSTGSGRDRTTHFWGFLALHLDRKLPNMVLDSKENNTLLGSDLPVAFKRDQVLSLEGDFDKHFTLYCPQEYQTDALYVFTPDLMALLVDDAGSYDVEIVDDWMFVYSPHQFPPVNPATYQRLFTIITTVGAKTVGQTENYHDDRTPSSAADIVAPSGQRLRHGTSVGALVIAGAFAAFWLYSVVHGFLH